MPQSIRFHSGEPTTSVFAERPWPAWFAAVALLACVAFSFWGTVDKPDCMDQDFGAYYRAAAAVADGQSPYFVEEHGALGTYPYAPVFPFLLMPLAQLDYLWACRVWLLVTWLTLAACGVLALRLSGAAGQWPVLAVALVPTAAYAWATLRVGQVSGLMLLGCLAWAVCRREGWRFVGGLVLAVPCALKLAPGILVVYLLLRRDYRGLAGVAAGTALLFGLPALWVGEDGALELHREWIRHTARTQVPIQVYRPGNQSLLGQLARLPAISNGHECYSADNLEELCRYYPLLVGVGGLLGLAALTWRRRGTSECGAARETWELALLLTFMTLAQPRGWRCNFVAMLLPCVLLAVEVSRQRQGWKIALAALEVMTVACALPTNDFDVDGWSVAMWLLEGKHFWGAAAVGTACWMCSCWGGSGVFPSGKDVNQSWHDAGGAEDRRVPLAVAAGPHVKIEPLGVWIGFNSQPCHAQGGGPGKRVPE
jgi:hypothetical protein